MASESCTCLMEQTLNCTVLACLRLTSPPAGSPLHTHTHTVSWCCQVNRASVIEKLALGEKHLSLPENAIVIPQ